MVIIKAMGGLGNQLFQYALYKKMEFLGHKAYMDLCSYGDEREKRSWMIDVLVDDIKYCTSLQRIRYANLEGSVYYRIANRLINKEKTHFYEQDSLQYYNEVFEGDYTYLEGYWQSEKYFKDIRDILLKSICFPKLSERYIKYAELVRNTNSVSVHIRRGDYLNHSELYVDLSKTAYYSTAIQYICEKEQALSFFIFSDDIEWCKNEFNINYNNVIYIDSGDEPPYEDMHLMSLCKHHIIANSSFSWWGAWLSEYENKTVIMPSMWYVGEDRVSLSCDGWIVI